MSTHYTEKEIRKARRRVKAKKGFYSHLAAYTIIIVFLFLLNHITSPGNYWFQFPLLGWGVAIAFHYLGVFGIPGMNHKDKNWENQEIEKELRKIAPTQNNTPTVPEDELELKEFKKLRDDWKDSDFV